MEAQQRAGERTQRTGSADYIQAHSHRYKQYRSQKVLGGKEENKISLQMFYDEENQFNTLHVLW